MTSSKTADRLFIGVMSGTSLDGADAVLAGFPADFPAGQARVLAHVHAAFPPSLHARLLDLQASAEDELHRAALAGNALADHYAGLVHRLLEQSGVVARSVTALGVHGQTLRHCPEQGYSLQLNAPARLAEATGIDVVADFRSRDVAAGGQGAPLVPAFHHHVFRAAGVHRVVLNVGGMANVTDLPPDLESPVRGWDTGPGNVLMDAWIARWRGVPYDAAGAWAASGRVHAGLLQGLRAEPWLALDPPKSTGRDLFNTAWMQSRLDAHSGLRQEDVAATLSEFTAATVADAIARYCPGTGEVIVCGGGARNTDLLARLERCLNAAGTAADASVAVVTSDSRGIPADQVEALAFAWLALRFCSRLAGNLPSATGARGSRILGCLYPA